MHVPPLPVWATLKSCLLRITLVCLQAAIWTSYAELELSSVGNLESAKVLFGRCLLSCPSVELHLQYLKWV